METADGTRICDRCRRPLNTRTYAREGRYCVLCENAVVKEMQESRYLQDTFAGARGNRPGGSRENIRDTKYGKDDQ